VQLHPVKKNVDFKRKKITNLYFCLAFAFTHILSNYNLELIGYATDDHSETKSFDEIKSQQYSTQSLNRIYRLSSSSFVLIQLTSSIKSDRLWPLTEQIFSKFKFTNFNSTNPVYIIQSRLAMDYVTIAGEFENKANLFVRYVKSQNIPTDDKLSQVIKPMEPPNAIRGLSAACKKMFG